MWSTYLSFTTEEARHLFDEMCLEFDDLAECVWKLNAQIPSIWRTELEKVRQELAQDPTVGAARFYAEKRNVKRVFPLLLNYSFVTTTFALYERHLARLADQLQMERQFPVTHRDLKGDGVGRMLTFLEKFAGINRTQLPSYLVMDTMRLIRNCIVHDAGYFHSRNAARAAEIERRIQSGECLVESHKHLANKFLSCRDPDGAHRIWIGADYAFVLPGYCREFLRDVFDAVRLATQKT